MTSVWPDHKKSAKRRVTHAGKNLLSGLLTFGVIPLKRIKRAPVKKVSRRLKIKTTKKRELDIFDDGFRAQTVVGGGQ